MKITRREFLKYSAVTGAVLSLGIFELTPIQAYAEANPPDWKFETFNVCCYCGVGCGVILGTNDAGQITYVEGDPDNPNNNGALCSKGASCGQLNHIENYTQVDWYKAEDSERVIFPLKREPGASEWTRVSWGDAISDIAGRIASTRVVDSNYCCTNIAALGTAKDTNEECYLYTKLIRSLGILYLEHCARL
ncbi:MAG: twin-arginine translocation signal domain-containing protein [Desulfobulbaceae bacterium]|nr:twin-arginine translocation signal domain-containing protein [Desulfobulbaceae bacterium]